MMVPTFSLKKHFPLSRVKYTINRDSDPDPGRYSCLVIAFDRQPIFGGITHSKDVGLQWGFRFLFSRASELPRVATGSQFSSILMVLTYRR